MIQKQKHIINVNIFLLHQATKKYYATSVVSCDYSYVSHGIGSKIERDRFVQINYASAK